MVNEKYMFGGIGLLLGVFLEFLAYVFGSFAVTSSSGLGVLFCFWSTICAMAGTVILTLLIVFLGCVIIDDFK